MRLDSFLFNNVRVKYVGTDPDTGISFYVNDGHGGVIGVRVYPDGRMAMASICTCHTKGSRGADGRRKQSYLYFRNAFGYNKGILAAHAVYTAWVGPIKPGMTIDHIDSITTDNRVENLRQIDLRTNMRDGGFLRKLRNKGIDPKKVQRPYLLRYFNRMAALKVEITEYRYQHLTKQQLKSIIYDN